jgi:uncharacterized protein with PhoU and TrkA domain
LTEPLSGKEHQARQRANEVEGEVESLTVARALLAIKATLGSDRAAEELSALDDRVSNLTEEAVRLEAQAAKARSDAELRKPADERGALKEQQGLEERILEVTNTRRQLMIDAGALSVSPGSEEMLEIALGVEDRMRGRFGEEAQWRMPADDAEFGVEWRDGQLRRAAPLPPP